MIGAIEATNRSKSGKTIGVQIGGQWYTSKNWELEQAVGRTVIFEPSTAPASGNFPEMHWMNDYVFEDAATGPAAQVMNQAMAANGQPPMAQPPVTVTAGTGKDRDASIVAQALTKASANPGDSITDVWVRYKTLYESYMNWNP